MENGLLPMQRVPPLHVADGSEGTAGPLQFGIRSVAGAARKKLYTATSCLKDSGSGFSSRFTPKPFPWLGITTRLRKFKIRVLLLLGRLPNKANELYLPKAIRHYDLPKSGLEIVVAKGNLVCSHQNLHNRMQFNVVPRVLCAKQRYSLPWNCSPLCT